MRNCKTKIVEFVSFYFSNTINNQCAMQKARPNIYTSFEI